MNFDDVQKRFIELQKTPLNVHPKIRGVIIGLLDKACGSKENCYQFAKALGLPAHSKDWNTAEWYAVSQIVKVDKIEGGTWFAGEPNFYHIIGAVMAHIGHNEKQPELITPEMFDAQMDRINGEA